MVMFFLLDNEIHDQGLNLNDASINVSVLF